MAYPSYYPQYYPQMYQPVYQPQVQQQVSVPKQEPIQSNGFVPVPSEDVARNYPVGNGLSVTFKDENAPYIYTKTMGFSQLDRPIFEKYRLVKENDASESASEPITEPKTDLAKNDTIKDIKADIEQIKDDLDDMQKQIDAIKENPKKGVATKRREDGDS